MNLSSTRHLGGTITAGSPASGSRYASHTTRAPHTTCWMELAVFPDFPTVPSLSGTQLQGRQNLLDSTKGAGAPCETSLVLQMELFDDECPQLCANFRRLCSGVSATRQGTVYCHQGLTPSYRGTYFHKIIPAYCAQGGDVTMRVVPGGSNSYSSAGRGWLNDESKKRRHNEVGLVSMANNGPNSNASQFFITTSAANERSFNGKHCCIGRVVSGLDRFMQLVAPCGDKDGRPSRYVVVVDCGEGLAPSATLSASTVAGAPSWAETERGADDAKGEGGLANTGRSTVTDGTLGGVDEGGALPDANAFTAAAKAAVDREDAEAAEAKVAADIKRTSAPPEEAPAVPLPAAAAATATAVAAPCSPDEVASPVQPLKSSMKRTAAAATATNKHVTYKE